MAKKKKLSHHVQRPKKTGRTRIEEKDISLIDPKNRPTEDQINKVGMFLGRPSNLEREVYRSIDLLKTGMSAFQCREILENEINPNTKKKYSPRFANDVVIKANALIKEYYKVEQVKTHQVHIARYNNIVNSLLTKKYVINPHAPWLAQKQEIDDLHTVLNALKQKEDLLGIHRKTFRVIVNNKNNIVVNQVKPTYDLTKLSTQEKVELMQLIQIAKKGDDEINGVLLRERINVDEIIEDTDFEELPTNADVNKIESFVPEDVEVREKNKKGMTVEQLKDIIIAKQVQKFDQDMKDNRSVVVQLLNKIKNKK